MRSAFIICVVVISFLSCAKKTTPAASVDNKPVAETTKPVETKPVETKVPVEVKAADAIAVESSMSVAGHAVYDAKCGRCHDLKKPAEYMLKQWIPILEKMAPRARLDSAEKANVLAYLSFYAKAEN